MSGGTNGLAARIHVARRPQPLEVDLHAARGSVVAVIGPNGAGKTTLLRTLAGLLTVDDGAVDFDGRAWDGPALPRPLAPQERDVAMVFQQHLLFPHLTALANVAFGPLSRGSGRKAAEATARHWLERVGVPELAQRRPAQLSGGQAQRVAIARALATDPDLLLLDEPLAALDVGVAMALRAELAGHLADFRGVTVLVTHDAVDAVTLADRVLVLEDGRVAQLGSPAEVAQRPRTDHVARLVGVNVVRGHSRGTDVLLPDGRTLVTTTPLDGEVFARFSPAAVTLATEEPTGSARNRWPGTVRSLAPHGSAVRVHVDTGSALIADVTPESATRLRLVPGRRVWAVVKATEIAVYGAGAGAPPER